MTRRKNETKEAFNKRQREYRANLSQERKEQRKAKDRMRMRKNRLTWTDEKRKEISRKERERLNSCYVVYKHILGEKIYIGMGNKARPNDFTKRKPNYKRAFPETPRVEIIGTFKHRHIAELCESGYIRIYGIENLVNSNQPRVSYKRF